MTNKTKTTKDDNAEALKAAAEKAAESLPKSAGVLIDEARKADTRADADFMTNQGSNPNAINIVKELQKDPEETVEEKKKSISEAEYERRTKLDVSNPEYINPSLGHFKAGK